jgi:hypothetical protein
MNTLLKPRSTLFLALLALGMWLIKSPYYGLWHDTRFYALIAEQQLHLALYHNDLFFLYGSQASYTLFGPWLVAWIHRFGLDNGLLYATIIGQIASIAGLMYLARAMLPQTWVIGLLIVSLLPTHYTEVFAFSEPFVTPRLYAEALAMFGLGALLRQKYLLGIPMLLLAVAVHPLMGLPAIIISLLLIIKQPKNWLLFGALAGVAVAMGIVFKLGPLAHMANVLNPSLVEFEHLRSPWLFIHLWPVENFSVAIYSLLMLILASVVLNGLNRQIARAALLLMVGALLLSAIADASHQEFLLALQPARAFWLTQVLSELLWLPVAIYLWHAGRSGRMAAILLAIAAVGAPETMIPIAGGAVAYWWGSQHYSILQSRLIQRMLWLIPAQEILFTGLTVWSQWQVRHFFIQLPIAQVLLATALPTVIVLSAGVWLWQPRTRMFLENLLVPGALILLLTAVNFWDVRAYVNPPDSVVREQIITPLRQRIPSDAVVYWEGKIVDPWFWLQRSQYITITQLAGTIFDERTAIEGMRRMQRMKTAGFPDNSWDNKTVSENSLYIQPHTLSASAYVCADPIVHTLILRYPVAGLPSEYAFVDPNDGYHYYAYACVAILAAQHTATNLVHGVPSHG